jgi:preprotein translocase subunit YajC
MSMYLNLLQSGIVPVGGSGMNSFIMIGLVMRPQLKKQKAANTFLAELERGTKVVTIGGICGKIIEIRNKSFLIEVEGGNRLQILKSAVSLENSKAFLADGEDTTVPAQNLDKN